MIETFQYLNPLSRAIRPNAKANDIGVGHICFEVEDISQGFQELRRKGVEFASDPVTIPTSHPKAGGIRWRYFYGPITSVWKFCKSPREYKRVRRESTMRLKGKGAVVTSAARGISRASAVLFAKEGAKVTAADNRRDLGQETVRLIDAVGGQAHFALTDVANEAQVQAMVDETGARWSRLDSFASVPESRTRPCCASTLRRAAIRRPSAESGRRACRSVAS